LTTISKLVSKLRDSNYRKAFVASQINIGIPFQIRALLKARNWNQEELAKRAGMLQPRISALLSPGKARPNVETLRRIAEAFDCGLLISFVPFSELVYRNQSFDPESFDVDNFEAELRNGAFDQWKTTTEQSATATQGKVLPFSYKPDSGLPTEDTARIQASGHDIRISAEG